MHEDRGEGVSLIVPDSIQQIRTDFEAFKSGMDRRIKAFETPVTPTTILAWKADEDEFDLVSSIGGKWVTTSRWPGGGLGEKAISAGESGKVNIIPRYQREVSAASDPLMPLKTQSEIDTFVTRLAADLDKYEQANVKYVAGGNEPDAKRDGKLRFWGAALKDFGPTWGRHFAPRVRARGMGVIWELPQVNVNNIPEFVFGLVDSGAYQTGDKFSFHSYQSSADKHIARFNEAIEKVCTILPMIRYADICSLEWGIALGGPDSAKLIEEKKLHALTMELGLWLVAKYRIRRNKWPESYLSPFDDLNKPTFTNAFWRSVAA